MAIMTKGSAPEVSCLTVSGLFFFLAITPALPATTHYVDANNLTPDPPYLNWSGAATNIQDAIDAASDGDTVLVTNGVYATGIQRGYIGTSNRVVINKAIAVRSVTGPAQTLIVGAPDPGGPHGPGSIRCVYLASGAVLDGFTLTNGHTMDRSSDNSLGARGGGAWCETNAVLTNCIIVDNRAADDGGGVYGGRLDRCVITQNSTLDKPAGDGDGGGADSATLYNCVVSNNHGRKGGGVDDSVLFGCLIEGNNGRVFGGGAARSTLYQCTVVDNYSRRGGGVSQCEVYNSIVYHNRAAVGQNHAPSYIYPANGAFYFSCTTPMPESGSDNLTLDPQLASWSHLSTNSPCRGAGSPAYVIGAVDIDGQPFGKPPSLGADELMTGAAVGPLLPAIECALTNLAVGFVARFKLQVEGQTTQTRWDFSDGTLVTNQLIVTHAWTNPGTYPVRLTAWNDASGAKGVTATTMVGVVSAPISFVNKASPTPAFPYSSWATAADNIQAAIDVTNIAGRIVLVTNGVYDAGGVAVWGLMINRVALRDGVVVRSVNGPRFTFLRGAPTLFGVGDGAIRCAYVGDGAMLDGFTLTNGYTRSSGNMSREQGGGGAWCESRGIVTNCFLTGNTSALDGGGANGGIFYNCTFTGNHAFDDGGAVDDAILHDCIISNNVGYGAVSESEIHHSIIVSNNNLAVQGGVGDSTLNGCLIIGNTGPAAYYCELFNCVIRGNNGLGTIQSSLANCTVVEHFGTLPAVVYSRIRNSIIYYNSGEDISEVAMDHSCTPSPILGAGNIIGPPRFRDLTFGDLRLRPGSPGIDGGDDLSALIQSDLDGLPRPLDGNRDGLAEFDMGAYEFNPLFFISIIRSDTHVRLDWFDSPPGMKLQINPSLDHGLWLDLPLSPGINSADVPLSPTNAFFRLLLPGAGRP